jgi:predicted transcriptional regulator
MKKKFSIQISEEAAAQLAQLAERDGLSKAAIVRQVLARFLEGDDTRGGVRSASQHDDALSDRLERIEQGLKILSEVTALRNGRSSGRGRMARGARRRDVGGGRADGLGEFVAGAAEAAAWDPEAARTVVSDMLGAGSRPTFSSRWISSDGPSRTTRPSNG